MTDDTLRVALCVSKNNKTFHVLRLKEYINTIITAAQTPIICLHTCSKMPTFFVNCTANDAVVNAMQNVQQALLHFVNVMHPRPIIWQLDDDTPYPVVNRLSSLLFGGH